MKRFKKILLSLLVISYFGCTDDDRGLSFINDAPAPSNLLVAYSVTQDNTGTVTLTPNGDGATQYEIFFGDDSGSVMLIPGESVQNIYEEGTYEVRLIGTAINGKSSEITQPLVVSFQPPQNLVVAIENDEAVSKQVNVTVSAEFAITYEVDFGDGSDPKSGNIDTTVSHVYENAGIYTITITVMGAAIETTEYVEEFEVTAILQPIESAPNPPARAEADVISLYTEAYTNIPGTDFFPDWGQGGCCGSGWTTFDLEGDEMLQYINLSYQGNQLAAPVDVSEMEYIHLDVWTADVLESIEVSLISVSNGERPITVDLNPNAWTSIDIPISDFTDQNGFTVNDIHQLKYVGTPFAGGGTAFIDNIYFYRSPSSVITSMIEDFEGAAPSFLSFGNIADIEVIANPDQSGENTTANVAKMTKNAGSEVWAGAFFETAAFDVTTFGKINVKTWSPKVGAVVKLKLENVDASITHEVDLTTTVANEWENLLYDFSGAPPADYVRVVIFFDFGVSGDDSIYYYDEIELVNDTGSGSLTFEDFEGTPPAFLTFGNIADIEVIANPDQSGENTTDNVAKMTKSAGSEVWAGAFFETAQALNLTDYTKISIKTWSPKVGATVKLKLENIDASITHEVDLTTTADSTWENLLYDFSAAPVADYVRVVIFFDFGVSGDDSVYYFDEFSLTN